MSDLQGDRMRALRRQIISEIGSEKALLEEINVAREVASEIDPSKVELPIMVKGKWIRFTEEMDYGKPNCCLVQGTKESGKSALCEALATHYSEQDEDCKIFDLFGSRDGEALAWCRSPYKDKILFIHGDSVKLRSEWDSVKISDLTFQHFKRYKVIITTAGFYSSPLEEHQATERLVTILYSRTHWSHVWTLLLRELANLIYSRITIGEDQAKAKAYLIFFLREMRHSGFAVCGDSIKFTSVDSDIRSLADYTYFKACGKEGLPRELQYLYSIFEPYSVMRMPINQFIILSKKGTVGRGIFDCPPWHKKEKEDLFRIFKIVPDYGTALDLETSRGRINDTEHVKVVTAKKEGLNGKPISFPKLAGRCARSMSAVYTVVVRHNGEIDTNGFCSVCKRMNSPLETSKV